LRKAIKSWTCCSSMPKRRKKRGKCDLLRLRLIAKIISAQLLEWRKWECHKLLFYNSSTAHVSLVNTQLESAFVPRWETGDNFHWKWRESLTGCFIMTKSVSQVTRLLSLCFNVVTININSESSAITSTVVVKCGSHKK
jgi:hypothetical protein